MHSYCIVTGMTWRLMMISSFFSVFIDWINTSSSGCYRYSNNGRRAQWFIQCCMYITFTVKCRIIHFQFVNVTMAPLHKICVWTQTRKIKRKSLMRNSDWLKINLRLIFLICVQTQVLCNGAYDTYMEIVIYVQCCIYITFTVKCRIMHFVMTF